MDRRRAIVVGGATALVVAIPSFAQPKVWRIGCMAGNSRPPSIELDGFATAFRELGYIEGKNLLLEWRFADGRYERLDAFAKEFVDLRVDFIIVWGTPATLAAQRATKSIPIIMGIVGDPVASGIVRSLARPGGNVTGLSENGDEIAAKSLELLRAIMPKLSRVALLMNPANPGNVNAVKNYREAARTMGIQIHIGEARIAEEIEGAFGAIVRERSEAVVVFSDAMILDQRQKIAEALVDRRLPSATLTGRYVEAGALIGYGPSFPDLDKRTATYVHRIIRGAKPGDLPIEEPTRFELVINMKTARALGITIPSSLLLRANEVIE